MPLGVPCQQKNQVPFTCSSIDTYQRSRSEKMHEMFDNATYTAQRMRLELPQVFERLRPGTLAEIVEAERLHAALRGGGLLSILLNS